MINPEVFKNALVLTGPTGSGKSALAIDLAQRWNAEIVAMDSMTLYRGMDIGTAKPTLEERRGVAHHLLDVLDPWESATVAWWLEQAARCCQEIEARGKTALFVGGTPLYLKAMLFGLFEGPAADEKLREHLYKLVEEQGPEQLHRQLAQVDPVSAGRLHPNDVRRVVRALEVWELTGQPMSQWQQQWKTPPSPPCEGGEKNYSAPCEEGEIKNAPPCEGRDQQGVKPTGPRCVWLDWPREELYARINARVKRMFAAGLVAEVDRLLQLPKPLSKEAKQALGYKEVILHLEGKKSLLETIAEVQMRSRNFAKRQITWFRHLPGCEPVRGELTSTLWESTMTE